MIKTHKTPVSDTDDTDDEHKAGDLKYYSHGEYALTHQHWPAQVISAGGFNVHDVQGPEAAHRFNMHLASLRVRHLDSNTTQDSMLRFTCFHAVFEELKHVMPEALPTKTRKKPSSRPGLFMPLSLQHEFTRLERVSDAFLHPQLRLQQVEVANIICRHLRIPLSPESHRKLRSLRLLFGQKYVDQNGRAFWATDERRDIFRLAGFDAHGNALGCEAVCFLTIHNMKTVIPEDVEDSQNYALIRWLQPHPDSWERDALKRPVCPGPLLVNNCLWEYAKTRRPRLAMVAGRDVRRPSASFQRHKHFFGSTRAEQTERRLQEQNAYYALITTDSIVNTMNICPLFRPNTSTFDNRSWLQTITLR